ncbi:MAG: beta-ketoacyl-ACP synthase II [bacterium]|nr:beta-ketoacyl-ACP synthase II [bacterium]
MSHRRVVVTGMGIISPIGNTLGANWESIREGRSGIGPITSFDASNHASQIAGEVKNFDPETLMPKKDLKRYDRFSLLTLAAAKEAVEDADLASYTGPREKMGCILGVGIGGLPILEENHKTLLESGPRRVTPFLIPAMISNLAPGNVGIAYDLQGVNYTITSACTSGTHAVGEAFRMIRDGLQDLVVTGGAESATTPLGVAGFARLTALSTRNDEPTRASRPFDRDRDGFVIAEGAGLLVLEELESAKRRGAKIYAEVVGYGFSCDAYHITSPAEGGRGAVQSMKMALDVARMNPEDIGYINAHGTSTPANDKNETAAIKTTFGSWAKGGLMVSSTKSMTGHALGAAGGLEAVYSVMAVQTGIVPPTINLDNPDDDCDLDYVPHNAREAQVTAAMSNSFGFGGTNGTLIVKKFT